MTHRLQQRSALLIAAAGMWAFASAGMFLVIRLGGWSIYPSDNQLATIAQVGAFYFALFAARIPASGLVALVICQSTFRRPMTVGAAITVACELVRCGIQVLRQPWSGLNDLVWWIPVGFDLAGIVLLTMLTVAFTWIMGRASHSAAKYC